MTAAVISALFLFNNRFESNVPVLERLYRDRFSRRRYIMPFATEGRPDVIPVQEAGWYFSGHLAQAADRFIEPDVTHYVVISDDLFVNPALNERNLLERLALPPGAGWIKSLAWADDLRFRWGWAADGAWQMRRMSTTHLFRELPAPDAARARFAGMGLRPTRGVGLRRPADLHWLLATLPRGSRAIWAESLMMLGRPSPYPLLAGYADLLVIPAAAMPLFARLCGLFAAMNLFAELAVPTALALACDAVVTELPIGVHFTDPHARATSPGPLAGIEFGASEAQAFGERLQWRLDRLTQEFPADWLYAHPVKFSRWHATPSEGI